MTRDLIYNITKRNLTGGQAPCEIVNVAGATISTFHIEPGETVETNINSSGVYIVLTTDNRYNKKLAVK